MAQVPIIFKARHPRNLPASYYKPMGQILFRWTYTQLYLQSIVWHFFKIRDPKAARVLTFGLNPIELVKVFATLPIQWIKNPADVKELNAIHTEANRLRAVRNKLAHGIWGYKPNQRKVLRLTYAREASHRIIPGADPVSIGALKSWAAEFDALNVRLKKFHKHLGVPVP